MCKDVRFETEKVLALFGEAQRLERDVSDPFAVLCGGTHEIDREAAVLLVKLPRVLQNVGADRQKKKDQCGSERPARDFAAARSL